MSARNTTIRELVSALSARKPPFDGCGHLSFIDQLKRYPVNWTEKLEEACTDFLLYRTFGNAFRVEASENYVQESGILNYSADSAQKHFKHTPEKLFVMTLERNDAFTRSRSPLSHEAHGGLWWRFRDTDLYLFYDMPVTSGSNAYPSLNVPDFGGLCDLGLMLPDLIIAQNYSAARFPCALSALVLFCDELVSMLSEEN